MLIKGAFGTDRRPFVPAWTMQQSSFLSQVGQAGFDTHAIREGALASLDSSGGIQASQAPSEILENVQPGSTELRNPGMNLAVGGSDTIDFDRQAVSVASALSTNLVVSGSSNSWNVRRIAATICVIVAGFGVVGCIFSEMFLSLKPDSSDPSLGNNNSYPVIPSLPGPSLHLCNSSLLHNASYWNHSKVLCNISGLNHSSILP